MKNCLQPGEEIEIHIDNIGINGEGVGRSQGFTVFVDGALPGEHVRAHIDVKRTTFARAHTKARLTTSPHRREPPCPVFGRCGGCQLMHLAYEQQLEVKRQRVVDALQRIAKIDVEVMPCISSPQPLAYRNKIQLPVSANHRVGLYARNSHTLVEIERCFIHCPLGEKVLAAIQPLLGSTPLKHLLIKTAVQTQEVLVVLVTQEREAPTALAHQIFALAPEIKGVVHNINPSHSNTILGTEFHTLAGQGWIEEVLCDLRFKVSPASFFQVNPAQAEALYRYALTQAQLTGQEVVLDAYCGVGTLSLIFAQKSKKVIGIECVPEAVADAQANAQRNHIHNAHFMCGKAEQVTLPCTPDIALLNPPRAGCDPALLAKCPPRILYISCDPATLARDVCILAKQGYVVGAVQPFDMFPQTTHVECVVSLTKETSQN